MKKIFLITISIFILTCAGCKSSQERQEEVDFVPAWKEQKDRAHKAVEATESIDKERRRQMDIMDQ